jgi:phosphate transport system substrate-binding protein
VKVLRYGRVAGAVLAGSLVLAGCGSDDNAEAEQDTSGAAASEAKSEPSPSASGSGSDSADCASGTLNGEGSSAQANAINLWISKYQARCADTTINYNATGSGAGVKQFLANQVDWAGSDSALKPEEVDPAKERCGGNDAWNLPMAVGPIAVAYNLPGVDQVVLDGPAIAKIFTGKITAWDDDAIKSLNPDADLPDKDIKVIFRSDESGTTDNFLKYLAAAGGGAYSGTPSKKFDGGTGEGKAQSAGVQQAVGATDGAIAYMEYSFAKDAELGIAKVKTGSDPIELTAENAGKALAAATSAGSGNDLKLKLDYTTKSSGAYPIVLVTYEIVCSKGLDETRTDMLRGFLSYIGSDDGQKAISDIGYGTLPDELQSKVLDAVDAIAAK